MPAKLEEHHHRANGLELLLGSQKQLADEKQHVRGLQQDLDVLRQQIEERNEEISRLQIKLDRCKQVGCMWYHTSKQHASRK